MGLNEFAGYLAVAVIAFLTGWMAGKYGLRPYPFYLGAGVAFLGFFSSWLLVRDTKHHVAQEAVSSGISRLKNIFWETTWRNKNLSSVTQAGLVNNLNDGMVWGILPILLASKNFTIKEIGIITAVYPAVWGVGQIIAGKMADKVCKKDMLFLGMILQAIALILFSVAVSLLSLYCWRFCLDGEQRWYIQHSWLQLLKIHILLTGRRVLGYFVYGEIWDMPLERSLRALLLI